MAMGAAFSQISVSKSKLEFHCPPMSKVLEHLSRSLVSVSVAYLLSRFLFLLSSVIPGLEFACRYDRLVVPAWRVRLVG
jgi:hypothetical protein